MSNFVKGVASILVVLLMVAGLWGWIGPMVKDKTDQSFGLNDLETLSVTATTTTSALPVLVLERSGSRQYALITNDSDTVIYLYPANFSSVGAASTTVGINKGIRLAANGGSYEINEDNLIHTDLYASSTATGKRLIVIYKQ